MQESGSLVNMNNRPWVAPAKPTLSIFSNQCYLPHEATSLTLLNVGVAKNPQGQLQGHRVSGPELLNSWLAGPIQVSGIFLSLFTQLALAETEPLADKLCQERRHLGWPEG